jgi:preprotein translocase subunit SecF
MEIIRPDASFDIIGKIKLFVGVSTAFVLLSLLLLMTKGINYGIDFTGGTLVQVQFKEAKPIGDVRSALAGLSLGDTVIQNFGSEREFLIRVEKSSGDIKGVESVVRTALIKKFGKEAFEMRRTEMVGPKVGADLRQKALSSMLFALIGILIYISFRFQFRQAIASVVALLHDVIITLGVFSLSGKEFSLPIVAAVLTIIGYSLNDTIVVFDRIRENVVRHPDRDLGALVNLSIMESMGRSLNTSLTTLFVLIAMLLIGGPSIRELLLCLAIGAVAGTYSSIFIASQFLVMWDRGEIRRFGRSAATAPSALFNLLGK